MSFPDQRYRAEKEVSVSQQARYEEVAEEVDKRAERMACKDLGIPEGSIALGMCHWVWKHKKRILKEEYGIEWHSPAELNPDILYD